MFIFRGYLLALYESGRFFKTKTNKLQSLNTVGNLEVSDSLGGVRHLAFKITCKKTENH